MQAGNPAAPLLTFPYERVVFKPLHPSQHNPLPHKSPRVWRGGCPGGGRLRSLAFPQTHSRAPNPCAPQLRTPLSPPPSQESGAEVVQVVDSNWQHDARGLPGQQLSLQLLLRVVADVGIVGFPNAGGFSGGG